MARNENAQYVLEMAVKKIGDDAALTGYDLVFPDQKTAEAALAKAFEVTAPLVAPTT